MVGKHIKALREERGVTQQQLADAIYTKPQFISAIERELRSPSVEQVAVFAELSPQEQAFIQAYRAAPPRERRFVEKKLHEAKQNQMAETERKAGGLK